MIVKNYRMEIFRPECNPGFESLHCVAYLDADIREVLPYINSELGGFHYCEEPPSVTFKTYGRLITVHADRIAVNALNDREEAVKIVNWMLREINQAWENRETITPKRTSSRQPQIFEVLKLLPKTNCRECGAATCMVFAAKVAEGVEDADGCPYLTPEAKQNLQDYLSAFTFPDV